MFRLVTLLFWAAALASAESLLEQRVDELLRVSHALDSANAGIEVVQLATGTVLYSRDSQKLFTPASNTKLFSTAMALARLGPDYRMTTRLFQSNGDLIIAGGGDPSMSFIQIPYDKDAPPADPLAAIEALADELAVRGIRTVAGDVVGDDTAFVSEPFAPGWGVDDSLWEYGAPISALSLASNSIKVEVFPGAAAGDPATLEITPALEYFVIDNRVQTIAAGDHKIEVRRLGGRELQLSGSVSIKAGSTKLWLAVDDPPLYAATALYDALIRRGITVGGRPLARHRYCGGPAPAWTSPVVIERTSPPLIELLRVTDKVSQNLWAELVLRQVAWVRTRDGSRKAGLDELQAFLDEIGITRDDYFFVDASGLSRGTLVKPDAVVRLLRFMYASPLREAWMSLLPVGGLDGTLTKRFGKEAAAKGIQAKTGSLSHISALSGYADSATYGQLAFSILVNHTNVPPAEIHDFIDKLGMLLLE